MSRPPAGKPTTPQPAHADRSEAVAALKQAGVRQNTQDTYTAALRHFEQVFGGQLPATPEVIEQYIAFCATEERHAVTTIENRLAAISVFHRDQGFVNPVRTAGVRDTVKGLRTAYNRPPDKATPLTLANLLQLVAYWETQLQAASTMDDARQSQKVLRLALRDRAFFLIGFWFGYRSDELVRLKREHCVFNSGRSTLSCYLPSSKGDRDAIGETKVRSSLAGSTYPGLCPIAALEDWLAASNLSDQPGCVFGKIDRWGVISDKPLHIDSVIKLMRSALYQAGMDAQRFSSHSLKGGFAHWVVDQGGEVAALMSLVGWRDPKTAAGYVSSNPATFERLLQARATPPTLSLSTQSLLDSTSND